MRQFRPAVLLSFVFVALVGIPLARLGLPRIGAAPQCGGGGGDPNPPDAVLQPPAPPDVLDPAGAAGETPPVGPAEAARGPAPVWGLAGIRGYVLGEHVAPNGVEFKPLFDLKMDFNFWVWRSERVYAFADAIFWGQKPAPGITNTSQGPFDFSKREFDLNGGVAWNYYGPLEAGRSLTPTTTSTAATRRRHPAGTPTASASRTAGTSTTSTSPWGCRATTWRGRAFVSVGYYYPTKDMVDGNGIDFKPGPFARAFLSARDLLGDKCYLYSDVELIATRLLHPQAAQPQRGHRRAALGLDAPRRISHRHQRHVRPDDSRHRDDHVRPRDPAHLLSHEQHPISSRLGNVAPRLACSP